MESFVRASNMKFSSDHLNSILIKQVN